MNPGKLFRTQDGRNHAFTFALVCSLFLLWGLCNGMIDVLNKHFQNSLHVTKAQSALVQFSNYMGYFLMAIPSGMLARRFGYKGGIIIGLGLIALGAAWFIPATQIGTFSAFLVGLFILATGLTCLETVANPYTTVLGPADMGATRINLAQSCNGIGWMLGPILGGHFILSSTSEVNRSNATLYLPYLVIGAVVTVLLVVFLLSKVPDVKAAEEEQAPGEMANPGRSIWTRPHFVLAVAAQFLYVAAQTGIFSFFINYMVSDMPALSRSMAAFLPEKWTFERAGVFHVTEQAASALLGAGGFGLFLLGRIVGSLILSVSKPDRILTLFAGIDVAVLLLVVAPLGWLSVAALFASFFFMSIMFPIYCPSKV